MFAYGYQSNCSCLLFRISYSAPSFEIESKVMITKHNYFHSFEQNFICISHLQGQDNETLLLLILGKGSIENRDDKRVYYTLVKQMLQALTFG